MKTLKLLLLIIGMAVLSQAYSFSLFNIPDETVNISPVDHLTILMDDPLVVKPAADNTNVRKENFEDTIVIELDEVIVESRFPASAHECIMEQVPYPVFAQQQGIEGAVVVQFTFDDYGNVRVEESMSNDPRLSGYVTQQLESLKLKNCVVDVNRPYYMRFLFKLY